MDNTYKVNINIEKLRVEVATREDKKLKTFEHILNMCYNKIVNTNKTSRDYNCTFIIPQMIFGLPLFNLDECIKYIMLKLIDKGFAVHLAIPNKLFISWEPESEKQAIICRQLYLTPSNQYPALTNTDTSNIHHNNKKLNNSSNQKLFTSQKQNNKIYKPINDYKQNISFIDIDNNNNINNNHNDNDINIFRSKIDELFN